ncbi:MAG TPA: response regulator transcription factor [Herpetosiphonaceae bacterium]
MKRRILIVDDDVKIVELLQLYLEKEGYDTLVAYDGFTALTFARQKRPDLVLLDLMLPVMDGLDVCRILRAESNIPIIMLTAKTTEADMLLGLDLGADDYINKPFSPRQVVARVRTVLRRAGDVHEKARPEVRVGDLVIDFAAHQARLKDVPVHLTPKEFQLLETMAKEPGRAFSRLELLERVFGLDYEGVDRTIDVHVLNLRKKIEPDTTQPIYIQTVYGIGYRFAEIDE